MMGMPGDGPLADTYRRFAELEAAGKSPVYENLCLGVAGDPAILALIAKPWSRKELLDALKTSDDQEKTADARAALLESGDEVAQKAVLAWEERNPHENEVGSYLEIGGRRLGPFYTFGEISLKNRASWIRYENGPSLERKSHE